MTTNADFIALILIIILSFYYIIAFVLMFFACLFALIPSERRGLLCCGLLIFEYLLFQYKRPASLQLWSAPEGPERPLHLYRMNVALWHSYAGAGALSRLFHAQYGSSAALFQGAFSSAALPGKRYMFPDRRIAAALQAHCHKYQAAFCLRQTSAALV